MKTQYIKMTVVASLLFAQLSLASELREKVEVLEIAQRFISTIACGGVGFPNDAEDVSEIDLLRNVHTINRDPEFGDAFYYVLWSGDWGCSGGSGSFSFYLTEIGRHAKHHPFIIQSQNVFHPGLSGLINTRFIESFELAEPRKMIIVSSEHSEDDSNNFPSKRYRYEIISKPGDGWHIENKEYLGINRY